jgi:hypothetical protein
MGKSKTRMVVSKYIPLDINDFVERLNHLKLQPSTVSYLSEYEPCPPFGAKTRLR